MAPTSTRPLGPPSSRARAAPKVGALRVAALGVVGAVVVVAAACGAGTTSTSNRDPARPTTTTSPPTTAPITTSTAAAPSVAPDQVGPFKVGRRTVEVADVAHHRTLTVDVWYPATPTATGPPTRYSFLPTVYFDSAIALDQPPVSPGGPFPFVLYSHGSGGLRYVASWFTERLASHGFVVASPDHTGDTAVDQLAGTEVPIDRNETNRVDDSAAVISAMVARSGTAGDPFHAAIDPTRIGIAGHSFGGFTALAAVGGHTNDLGTTAPDPRIKAIVTMAPYTKTIPDAELARVDVPTMILTGTKDVTAPIDDDSTRPWTLVPGRPLLRLDLRGAAHQSFSDVCFYQSRLPTLKHVPALLIDAINSQAVEGCGPGFMAVDRAQDIAQTASIAFLEVYVAGDRSFGRYLSDSAAAAQWPDVTFLARR